MTSEFDPLYESLNQAVKSLIMGLDLVKRELSDDRIDSRTTLLRLEAIERSVDKLRVVVIEGNGSDALKTQIGFLQREQAGLSESLSSLKDLIREEQKTVVEREREDKRIHNSRNVAIIAAVAAIGAALIEFLTSRM